MTTQNTTLHLAPDKPGDVDDDQGRIDVALDEIQTPARVRELRLQAQITKAEAARTVGLSAGLTWHGYECGRFAMPDWRWQMFLVALKTGHYRKHMRTDGQGETDGKRCGPRVKRAFVPGAPRPEKPVIEAVPQGEEILKRARLALRLSPRALAEELGTLSASTLYSIEAGTRPISPEHLNEVRQRVAQRAIDLELMQIELNNVQGIGPLIASLRSSQDEVGRFMFPDANRPGAMISQYALGTSHVTPQTIDAIQAALESVRTASLLVISVALAEVEEALAKTPETV